MHDSLHHEYVEHRKLLERLDPLLPQLDAVTTLLAAAFERDGRLYTFGNGGSAADAQHLAAELVGRYRRMRRPLPAIALTVDPSVVTCIANDYSYDEVFARQVTGLVRPGDVVIGFTTSGRSPSVIRGLEAARSCGAVTVLFSGLGGGPALQYTDHALMVPSTTTARIQEAHLLLLHLLSEGIDAWAAAGESYEGEPGAVPEVLP